MKKFGLSINLIFFISLSACSNSNISVPTAVIEVISPLPIASPTAGPIKTEPIVTAAIEVPPIETAYPTLAPIEDPNCPTQRTGNTLSAVPFDDYPQAILEFLNTGATMYELYSSMQNLGIAYSPGGISVDDLNNDGRDEVIISLVNPDLVSHYPKGELLIFSCQGDSYSFVHKELSKDTFGLPVVMHIRDLNADEIQDMILSSYSCGANTCFHSIRILSWTKTGFKNLLDAETDEIPFPDVQLTDFDQDRIYDLEILGQGYGSAGAGPQRNTRSFYKFDSDSGLWSFNKIMINASDYRIHKLHDADLAMKEGEYQIGLLLYDQVFNDENLIDWVNPEEEAKDLGAYARFKMIVAYTHLGQKDLAAEFIRQFRGLYSPLWSQYIYVHLADAYYYSYLVGGLEAGCDSAIEFVSAHEDEVLLPLGPMIFGYSNHDYVPEEICP